MAEQFPPPLAPSELVDAVAYPATARFLRSQVDMQVADLRVLLRLPVPELDPHVGCNLTSAAVMLNIISGCSRWFFQTDEAAAIAAEEADGRPRSRKRFIGFVTQYWPQLPPEPSPDQVARRLYDVRNSLAHDLGVADEPVPHQPAAVGLAKSPLSLDDIVTALERNLLHPLKVPVIEERDDVLIVHLAGLYWALLQMLRDALADHPQQIETAIARVIVPEVEELPEPAVNQEP